MLKNKLWTDLFLIPASLVGIGTIIIILMIFSAFVCFLTDNCSDLSPFTAIALATGTFCSGFVCGRYRRKRGLFEGLLCGSIIYLILLAAGTIYIGFFSSLSIKKLLISAIFGAIGGVFGVNTKYPRSLYQ